MSNKKIEIGQVWNITNDNDVFVSIKIHNIFIQETLNKYCVWVQFDYRFGDEPVERRRHFGEDLAKELFEDGWQLFGE